jgi:hypothetical protein
MERTLCKRLWRFEPVDLGEGCMPTRLGLSPELKNNKSDAWVIDYLMKNRQVMCRTHFKCLNYAGDRNWDGFDCRDCPRAVDPSNRISEAEILDDIKGLMALERLVHHLCSVSRITDRFLSSRTSLGSSS